MQLENMGNESAAQPHVRGGRDRGWRRWRTAGMRTVEKDLHRLIRRELQDLGVTPPLDVHDLCERLSQRRGRPLFLRAAPLPKPGPSGMWAEYDTYDVILYQQETTELHQDGIILHEVGHILVAEKERAAEDSNRETETPDSAPDGEAGSVDVEGWAALMPVFGTEAVKRIAQRCSYDDGEECSVELVATIILEWSALLASSTPPADDPALRRVEAALGDRRGWL